MHCKSAAVVDCCYGLIAVSEGVHTCIPGIRCTGYNLVLLLYDHQRQSQQSTTATTTEIVALIRSSCL